MPIPQEKKFCGLGVPPALNIQFKCATAYRICKNSSIGRAL
ncbi:hypothetical protein QUB70_23390 [Microcoleus sp. A003_D6]